MLLVISFVVFMLLGLPLFGVIGLASIISMIGMPFPMEFIPQNLYTGMDQFPLIATIGFVMAGFLMEPAGITGEIIDPLHLLKHLIKIIHIPNPAFLSDFPNAHISKPKQFLCIGYPLIQQILYDSLIIFFFKFP